AITLTKWDTFLRQFSSCPRLYSELEKELSVHGRTIADSAAPDWRARVLDRPSSQRSEVLADFICEQVAQVLGLTGRIDVAQPLLELGLDSLMSVTLINRVEQMLGVRIPITKLIKGPSIVQLVQDIGSELLQAEGQSPPRPIILPSQGTGGTWVVLAEPRAAARFRLLCFPFAGGGSAVFRSWANSLDPSIEVIGVEPPGRLGRIQEKPVSDIEEFVDALTSEILPLLDKPFAFFGHCLGGLT